MVLPLCVLPHQALRQSAQPIEQFTQEIQRFAQDLIETMYANDGIGLAAPQVGQNLQMFVANPSQKRGRELIMLNPILEVSKGRASVIEGCLSIPNVWNRVRRAAMVQLRGQDVQGQPLSLQAEGLLAIVLQHEVDHLSGRLFIDHLSWFSRQRLRRRGVCG